MSRFLKTSILGLTFSFLYIPIIVLIVNSFNANRFGFKWDGFTLKWYERLIENDNMIQALVHSITLAFVSATLATIIGAITAISLYRYKFRSKSFINGMLFLIIITPDIVMAISFLVLFIVLGISLGFKTLLISHITFSLPFVVIAVMVRLKGFDNKMLEAAKDLGASEFTIIRKIILPLILPAVSAGWLLSFTISLDDVVISSFISSVDYDILPVRIFSLVKSGVTPEVNSLATLMILFSFILVISMFIINLFTTKTPTKNKYGNN